VSAKARGGVYVERAERRRGWGWVRLFGGAAALLLVAPAWVILLNGLVHGFGEFLAKSWPIFVYFPIAGLPFAVVVVADGIHTHRNVDREGVSLIVDEAGIYLGLARPRRIAWDDIDEIALVTYRVPRVRDDISTPPAYRYYLAIRLRGAKERENPMRWRPRKPCRDSESLDAAGAAIRRFAQATSVFTTTR
jgi:hypothetical protein